MRAVTIVHNDIFDLHMVVDCMDCHLGFDFKALGKHRKGLHKAVAKCPITGHNVLNIGVEQMIDAPPNKAVAEVVKRPFIFGKICGGRRSGTDTE